MKFILEVTGETEQLFQTLDQDMKFALRDNLVNILPGWIRSKAEEQKQRETVNTDVTITIEG